MGRIHAVGPDLIMEHSSLFLRGAREPSAVEYKLSAGEMEGGQDEHM